MTSAGGFIGFLFTGFLFALTAGQPAGPAPGLAPRCGDASHARLIVQPGRDVCGPTLLPTGPVSVGFLPTECPKTLPFLRTDADKTADQCFDKPAALPSKP